MRRSSTLLTRLALALLAVLGFVAPLCAAEPDRVVQTCGGKPSAGEVLEAATPRSATEKADEAGSLAAATLAPRSEPAAVRKYLLHRAWLL